MGQNCGEILNARLEYEDLVLILKTMEEKRDPILNKGMTYVEPCQDLFRKENRAMV